SVPVKRLVASAATISMSVLDGGGCWVGVGVGGGSRRPRVWWSGGRGVLPPGDRRPGVAPRVPGLVPEQPASLVDAEERVVVTGAGPDRNGRVRLGHQLVVRAVAGGVARGDD